MQKPKRVTFVTERTEYGTRFITIKKDDEDYCSTSVICLDGLKKCFPQEFPAPKYFKIECLLSPLAFKDSTKVSTYRDSVKVKGKIFELYFPAFSDIKHILKLRNNVFYVKFLEREKA